MRKEKRGSRFLMACVIVLALIPVAALAGFRADGDVTVPVEGGNIYFRPSTGEIVDADYWYIGNGKHRSITGADIPASVNGVLVTSIGDHAFTCCQQLKGVTIPNTVKTLDQAAFQYCESLTSITIPDSVTRINRYAFEDCHGLTSITIPKNVSYIGHGAFLRCYSLTEVTIPKNVTSFEDNAFGQCKNLKHIDVDPNNPSYTSVDGVLFTKDMKTLVSYPAGKEGPFTMPESVTSIGDMAFYGDEKLTDVYYSGSVSEWERIEQRTKYFKATVHCNNNGLLTISTQPQSITASPGDTAAFLVQAQGDGLTYQWYTKNVNQTRFYKSSIKSPIYTVTAAEKMSGRQLYCEIRDSYGNIEKSETVTLTVERPGPVITTQPQSVTVAAGDTAAVAVQAQGDGLTYQWYTKNANQTRFYKSSVTSDTYSVITAEKMNGRQLYCVVRDSGGKTVTTDTVTLTVEKRAAPLVIVTPPQNVTVRAGNLAVVSVTASGDGLTYQWYVKNSNQSRFYKSIVTGPDYIVTAAAKMSGRQLYCVVKDANDGSVTTETVTLTVN